MSLTLSIETSSINYGAALSNDDTVIAHRTLRRDDRSFEGIGPLVLAILSSTGNGFSDVGRLAVDVGPGNLSSVRAGVAYANGLAFSLQKMIFTANSLDLLALEVAEPTDHAVLCLRNAGGGNVYAGLFPGGASPSRRPGAGGAAPSPRPEYGGSATSPRAGGGGAAPRLRHGPKEAVVRALAGDLTEVSVAGTFRHDVAGILPGVFVKDTGVEFPNVLTLPRLLTEAGGDRADLVHVASPLNDASAVFGDG